MKKLLLLLIILSSSVTAETTDGSGLEPIYKLNTNETRLLEFLIRDDIQGFTAGDESMLAVGMNFSYAKEMSSLYDANQVAGNQKYLDKLFRITGNISHISAGPQNEPLVLMSRVVARFKSPDLGRIAKLNKGEKLTLVCFGGGVYMNQPLLVNCEFPDVYVRPIADKLRIDIANLLSEGKAESEVTLAVVVGSIASAKMLSTKSACFATQARDAACKRDIEKIQNDNDFKKHLADAAEVFKKSKADSLLKN